jgi:hypothetical protein
LVPRFNGKPVLNTENNLNLLYVFVYKGKELYSKTSSGYFMDPLSFILTEIRVSEYCENKTVNT